MQSDHLALGAESAASPGVRLRRARELLQQTSLSITTISIACGFAGVSSFSKAFRQQYGFPPSHERKEKAV